MRSRCPSADVADSPRSANIPTGPLLVLSATARSPARSWPRVPTGTGTPDSVDSRVNSSGVIAFPAEAAGRSPLSSGSSRDTASTSNTVQMAWTIASSTASTEPPSMSNSLNAESRRASASRRRASARGGSQVRGDLGHEQHHDHVDAEGDPVLTGPHSERPVRGDEGDVDDDESCDHAGGAAEVAAGDHPDHDRHHQHHLYGGDGEMRPQRQHRGTQREGGGRADRYPEGPQPHGLILAVHRGQRSIPANWTRLGIIQAAAVLFRPRSARGRHHRGVGDFLVVVAVVAFATLMMGLIWALDRA